MGIFNSSYAYLLLIINARDIFDLLLLMFKFNKSKKLNTIKAIFSDKFIIDDCFKFLSCWIPFCYQLRTYQKCFGFVTIPFKVRNVELWSFGADYLTLEIFFVENDVHRFGSIYWNTWSSFFDVDPDIFTVYKFYSWNTTFHFNDNVIALAYCHWFEFWFNFKVDSSWIFKEDSMFHLNFFSF